MPSTNTHAWHLIGKGAQSGLIITNNQYKGRGQRKNNWISSIHGAITFSLFIKKELSSNLLTTLPILTGLSVQQALLNFNVKALLKWPNDIILNNKKIGGVLCESNIRGDTTKYIVIGIGINVNDDKNSLIKKKLNNATSLKIEYGSDYEREIIISSIVDRLELNLNLFPNNLKKIIHDWEAVCCHINKNINFKNHIKSGEGKFLGLDDDGSVKIIVNEKLERFSDLQII